MKSLRFNREFAKPLYAVTLMLSCLLLSAAAAVTSRTFTTPQAEGVRLSDASENFAAPAREAILGPAGKDIIHTGEPAYDQQIAKLFAEQARTKMDVSIDPQSKNRAFIIVGDEDWPFPVPI